jgi:hypothetical protein
VKRVEGNPNPDFELEIGFSVGAGLNVTMNKILLKPGLRLGCGLGLGFTWTTLPYLVNIFMVALTGDLKIHKTSRTHPTMAAIHIDF